MTEFKIMSVLVDGEVFVRQEKNVTGMRRFLLWSDVDEEKCWQCLLWGNGEVSINIAQVYRTHFASMTDFKSAHAERIEWLDPE